MDQLKETLDAVNNWLKFAEAKNAIVVTASGAALWGAIRLMLYPSISCYLAIYLGLLLVCCLGALIISLLSFLPVLNYRWIVPKKEQVANGNLLYFGYLATLSKNQLVESYRLASNSKETDINDLHRMCAEQIIINSRIALAKYSMFGRAVNILIYGVLTPIIAFPLLLISRKRGSELDGI